MIFEGFGSASDGLHFSHMKKYSYILSNRLQRYHNYTQRILGYKCWWSSCTGKHIPNI